MSHTTTEKLKLLNRVRRVRGQIEAVERAIAEEQGTAFLVIEVLLVSVGANLR
jgi:DNA-binding FrmR family transcriptional regulator